MSLIIRDTISLTTASGVSKIQLCIGDITKLPKQEEADVLVVSAFPGLPVNTIYSSQQIGKYSRDSLKYFFDCGALNKQAYGVTCHIREVVVVHKLSSRLSDVLMYLMFFSRFHASMIMHRFSNYA